LFAGECAVRIVLATLLFSCSGMAQQEGLGPNVLSDGGFESGALDWWRPPDRYGGGLDTSRRHGGLNSWRMDLAHPEHEVILSRNGTLRPGSDHHLSVWIRCDRVSPANAICIRALQFAKGKPSGWYERAQSSFLIRTGGSHDWFRFAVNISDEALQTDTESLAVFLRGEPGCKGTVWFDDVSLRPILGEAPGELTDAQAAPPLSMAPPAQLADEVPQTRDIPFLQPRGEPIEIDCGNDSNVLYGPKPIRVRVSAKLTADDDSLQWTVSDYWGRKLAGGSASSPQTIFIGEYGYFEVAVRMLCDGEQVGAARTCVAHIPEHPFGCTSPEYCFGSWVQQADLLDDIGARWTRVGTGWQWLEPKKGVPNDGLWEGQDAHLKTLAQTGIRPIFLFAKVPKWAGPHYKRVGVDHWDDFRAYVRKCVSRYANYVDVWEVMNEPYIPTLFPGTLQEIMQWHRIVREEVDAGDPGARVIGPCVNTRRDYLLSELRDLLELGIGNLIHGISTHTYGGLEAAGFAQHFGILRALLREYNADKPLFITEQGLSVPEELGMERMQAQYIARMILLSMQVDVEAVIWHMMSWPQGGSAEQRDFAIVRARDGLKQRAPRPAFVAAATVSRMLGKAGFTRTLDGLGDGIGAQLYDLAGRPVVVLWDWATPGRRLSLTVGVPQVTVVDIMGKAALKQTDHGVLTIQATPDPVFILGADVRAINES